MPGKNKNPRSWYKVSNKSGETPEIFIYDEIGGWGIWAVDLISKLKDIDAPRIRVRIHSPGGFVSEGVAIFNALRKHSAAIDVEIDSIAASIASVVAMAGDTISIASNALMMIHNPWGGAVGTAEDMRKAAEVMDKFKETIVTSYANRTGIDAAEIEKMMDEETWFTAEEAMAAGFVDMIDEVDESSQPSNSFHGRIMNSFRNAPESVKQLFPASKNQSLELPPLDTTSVGSGRRDQGKHKEEPMKLDELKAQMKQAGIDVDALQAAADTVPAITAERDTARTELTTLQAAIGDATADEVKAALAARTTARDQALDDIVTARRALKMTGDDEKDVTAAKAIYAGFSDEQLAAEASQLKKLSATKDQLKPDSTDDNAGGETKNKYINEEGE